MRRMTQTLATLALGLAIAGCSPQTSRSADATANSAAADARVDTARASADLDHAGKKLEAAADSLAAGAKHVVHKADVEMRTDK